MGTPEEVQTNPFGVVITGCRFRYYDQTNEDEIQLEFHPRAGRSWRVTAIVGAGSPRPTMTGAEDGK